MSDTPIPNTYEVVHEELLWFQDIVVEQQGYACFWSSYYGPPTTLPRSSAGGHEFKLEHRIPLTMGGGEAVDTLIVSCAWHYRMRLNRTFDAYVGQIRVSTELRRCGQFDVLHQRWRYSDSVNAN